jgi:hypothetical protein
MTDDYEDPETGDGNTNGDDGDNPPTVVKKPKKKKKKNRKNDSNKRMLDGANTDDSNGKSRKILIFLLSLSSACLLYGCLSENRSL